ncbi:MAG TPA: hypothetical protein VLT45_30400 [Kofleriaceae bacterium]|nr:hypothetical protein [Kofleriaceae bacterium]
MFAAALIPLMFIIGLLGLLLLGAWPTAFLPSLVIGAMLVIIAAMLAKLVRGEEPTHPLHH